jgi:hypothetical protein
MDIIEKIEKRENELLDELAKTKYGSAEYKAIREDLAELAKIKNNYLQTENQKYANNERNDIERAKVDVEYERIKTERKKIRAGLADSGIDLIKCCGFGWIAYNGDKVSYAVKSIYNIATGFLKTRKR